MKKHIILIESIIASLFLSLPVFSQVSIDWQVIDRPISESETVIEAVPAMESAVSFEEVIIEEAVPETIRVDTPAPETAVFDQEGYNRRVEAYYSELYPSIIVFNLNPEYFRSIANPVLKVKLSFDEVNSSKCVQLNPLKRAYSISETSGIMDILDNIDNTKTLTATLDDEGYFNFRLTDYLALISSNEMDNTIILRPFSPSDRFISPSSGTSIFTVVSE